MLSQNVTFSGTVVEESEDAHPPGEPLARRLHAGLTARGWTVGEIDAWRDGGWELRCQRDRARLVVVIAAAAGQSWFAQISPTDLPGLLRRALGRTPSAPPADIFALAVDVHELLVAGDFTQLRWAWDGFPGPGDPDHPPAPELPTAKSS